MLYTKRRTKQTIWSSNGFLQKNLVTIEQPFPSDMSIYERINTKNMYQIAVVEAFLHGINRSFYKKEMFTLITWSCTYFVFDIL